MTLGRLTPRERAVARYLLGGWCPESIAVQLSLQRSTVKSYVSEVVIATGQDSVLAATLYILRDPVALSMVMEVQLDDTTFVIDGLTYQAFDEGEFNGATSWMVRKYLTSGVDTSSNANYVETVFPLATKDAHAAVDHAIATNIWA